MYTTISMNSPVQYFSTALGNSLKDFRVMEHFHTSIPIDHFHHNSKSANYFAFNSVTVSH